MTTSSEAIAPLIYTAYAAYVLVPYVAHLLIADDLSCTPEEAFEIMMEGGRIGEILHPQLEDDPEYWAIVEMNTTIARRDRKRVGVLDFPFLFMLTRHSGIQAEALEDGYELDDTPGPRDANGRPLPRLRKWLDGFGPQARA